MSTHRHFDDKKWLKFGRMVEIWSKFNFDCILSSKSRRNLSDVFYLNFDCIWPIGNNVG